MILENLHIGIIPNGVVELIREASAFAAQAADGLGGTRGVALLAIVGFGAGLLACLLELKLLKGDINGTGKDHTGGAGRRLR